MKPLRPHLIALSTAASVLLLLFLCGIWPKMPSYEKLNERIMAEPTHVGAFIVLADRLH